MSTKTLATFLELSDDIAKMKALRQRFVSATRADAAITVTLNLSIDGEGVPANQVAFASRAIAGRVRATLPALWAAAIQEQEAALNAFKRDARAEFETLFGP